MKYEVLRGKHHETVKERIESLKKPQPQPYPQATATDVYHWPEFIAFANRLGIPHEALTAKLTITLDVNDFDIVRIAHDYHGSDRHLPKSHENI